ncbi:MAG: AP2/ERF family transcription factor [Clostridia bacterium]
MQLKKTTLNLIGETFGALSVESFSHYYRNATFWNCVCKCGNELQVDSKQLLCGNSTSCGCKDDNKTTKLSEKQKANISGVYLDEKSNKYKSMIAYKGVSYFLGQYDDLDHAVKARLKGEEIIEKLKKNQPKKPEKTRTPKLDLTGEKFGKLTVIEFSHFKGYYACWRCKCECGNEKTIYQQNLISETTNSCGCVKSQNGKKYHDENFTFYEGVMIEKAAAKVTPKNNTSGFRGVNYVKKTGKWRAVLRFKGERYELGHYHDFEEAKQARILAEEMIDDFLQRYKRTINQKEENEDLDITKL